MKQLFAFEIIEGLPLHPWRNTITSLFRHSSTNVRKRILNLAWDEEDIISNTELIDAIEKTGLVLADMESLIHHYDKTLKSWLDRFLLNKGKAKRMYSEKFTRMWEFYLASTSSAFRYRDLLVYQLQIVKDFHAIPSNRRDYIYN